ncbi:hypothetical protein Cni_G20677 [Canna indica]|uniref:Uncharacterized protein n=1 Tax=Canna indica TaxID=4628 RepID=A0AAQ3KN23_9LILI|nr:hypothetical protein Cni_G20677 [Canna indica]
MDSPSKSHLVGASTHKTLLFFLLLALRLSASFAETQVSDKPTVYEILETYDLPRGILPEGAQSYVLRQDGSFEVYLSGECEFKVAGSYLLKYKKKVTGTVGAGSLTNLQGVSVQVLWFWFGVNEVVRSGDELKFYVGPLSATFDLSSFEKCPRCRCGFQCSVAAVVSDA